MAKPAGAPSQTITAAPIRREDFGELEWWNRSGNRVVQQLVSSGTAMLTTTGQDFTYSNNTIPAVYMSATSALKGG